MQFRYSPASPLPITPAPPPSSTTTLPTTTMAPQSRGPSSPFGLSKSTPNLPNLSSFHPPTPPADTTPTAPLNTNQPRFPPTSPPPADDNNNDDGTASFHSHYSTTSPSSSSSSSPSPTHLPPRPPLRHSTSAFLSAHAFAPPFYNRPPTPLPPSPSLTSLLRPSFSTTTSRPTTPDSSENDTEAQAAAVEKSARAAMTVPRASPKVPTYEYYGFVLYVGSSLAFRGYSPFFGWCCRRRRSCSRGRQGRALGWADI